MSQALLMLPIIKGTVHATKRKVYARLKAETEYIFKRAALTKIRSTNEKA